MQKNRRLSHVPVIIWLIFLQLSFVKGTFFKKIVEVIPEDCECKCPKPKFIHVDVPKSQTKYYPVEESHKHDNFEEHESREPFKPVVNEDFYRELGSVIRKLTNITKHVQPSTSTSSQGSQHIRNHNIDYRSQGGKEDIQNIQEHQREVLEKKEKVTPTNSGQSSGNVHSGGNSDAEQDSYPVHQDEPDLTEGIYFGSGGLQNPYGSLTGNPYESHYGHSSYRKAMLIPPEERKGESVPEGNTHEEILSNHPKSIRRDHQFYRNGFSFFVRTVGAENKQQNPDGSVISLSGVPSILSVTKSKPPGINSIASTDSKRTIARSSSTNYYHRKKSTPSSGTSSATSPDTSERRKGGDEDSTWSRTKEQNSTPSSETPVVLVSSSQQQQQTDPSSLDVSSEHKTSTKQKARGAGSAIVITTPFGSEQETTGLLQNQKQHSDIIIKSTNKKSNKNKGGLATPVVIHHKILVPPVDAFRQFFDYK